MRGGVGRAGRACARGGVGQTGPRVFSGAYTSARSVAWVWGRVVGRWGGMATVRTVAAGARSRAWAAWAAEWVITVSARLSRRG